MRRFYSEEIVHCCRIFYQFSSNPFFFFFVLSTSKMRRRKKETDEMTETNVSHRRSINIECNCKWLNIRMCCSLMHDYVKTLVTKHRFIRVMLLAHNNPILPVTLLCRAVSPPHAPCIIVL